MFGLFKKKPIKPVFDYEFSSKVASTFEGFLIACAQDWDKPSEKLQNYSLHVSAYGMMSIQLNADTASDDSMFVVPFNQISKINSITPTVIRISRPGPFVNPLISMITDEMIDYIQTQYPDTNR